MEKIRIYEAAKKLGKPVNEIREVLSSIGITVKSNLQLIDSKIYSKLESALGLKKQENILERKEERAVIEEKKIVKEVPKEEIPQEFPAKRVEKREVPMKKIEKPLPEKKKISVREGITLKELSEKTEIKAKDIIQRLLLKGFMVTVNQALDKNLLDLIGKEFNIELAPISFEEELALEEGKGGPLTARPPVVTVMGHVDHGKTTLLDYIRKTKVAESEAGGITQHIGAYRVKVKDRFITFLDTPGHEAFTRMRARGAKVTDIVVLVVAADDGVMPQTLEAIDHAKAGNVPIIVAINKIDKPNANPEKVKQQLSQHGVVVEDWGGDVVCVELSAKTGKGVEELLEMILLVGDLLELKANPEAPAKGVILESKLDPKKGPLATVLIQNGTLKEGDFFLCGVEVGKVRAIFNEFGNRLVSASIAMPVVVMGFEKVPAVGDVFVVVRDVEKAHQIAQFRLEKSKALVAPPRKVSLEDLLKKTDEVKEFNVIIKGDVQGTVEVAEEILRRLESEKVKINIIHKSEGPPTESDVLLASASNSIIVSMNVKPVRKVVELAESENVDLRIYNVIYELNEDIKRIVEGLLEPPTREIYLGKAEVKQTFKIAKVGTVAGCYVKDGKINADSKVRVIRDGKVVYEGRILSLKRFKEDVKEVKSGLECGISIEQFNDIKTGDLIECFLIEKAKK
ncbi:MAG: translation initiation factor IF-2 [Candidatus Aminicenantia bacterium]